MNEVAQGHAQQRMPLADSLEALHAARRDEIVITTMGAAREWSRLGTHPRDFVLVPSSMGQATALGLGMALAQPQVKVVVCNGDGSMLMNLGSLITISGQSPANLLLIVFDNGVYEVTGFQPTPAAAALRTDKKPVDFAAIARSCGFQQVWQFREIGPWRDQAAEILHMPGPAFVHLVVAPSPTGGPPGYHGPPPERARKFRAALTGVEPGKR